MSGRKRKRDTAAENKGSKKKRPSSTSDKRPQAAKSPISTTKTTVLKRGQNAQKTSGKVPKAKTSQHNPTKGTQNYQRKETGRRSMVLTPKDSDIIPPSDASTVPLDPSLQSLDATGDTSGYVREEGGEILSDGNSLTDLEEDDEVERPNRVRETDPMRSDRPIVRSKWEKTEVKALMIAINVNRDAIKFHFQGPGGGKDVKREGWMDVAKYVNDIADTHRTVEQCRTKAAGYSQNAKDKYNKLRYQVTQTGRGKISKKLHLDNNQKKALDYLRREAVKGIPGIDESELGERKDKTPSDRNIQLLWEPDRDTKPDYTKVKMERAGVPVNYKDKNKRRIAREAKLERRKEYLSKMKADRKKDRERARVVKEVMKREKNLKRAAKERKKKRKEQRKLDKMRKEERKYKKERRRAERKDRKERKEQRAAREFMKAKKEAR